jgi:hypothetical protein
MLTKEILGMTILTLAGFIVMGLVARQSGWDGFSL